MLDTTVDAMRAMLKADPSITPGERSQVLTVIRNHGKPQVAPQDTPQSAQRIVRRAEAAILLARSPRAVDRLAQQGLLTKVKLPGRQRAAGFLMTQLMSLLEVK
jgi:hypothetical protein